MDIKHIKTQLARVAAVTENWNENENVPAIERQIVLEALASLYEEIRFGRKQMTPQKTENTPSEPESASENEQETEMATPIDLSNIFPAEGVPRVPASPEPEDKAEPAAEIEPSAETKPSVEAQPAAETGPSAEAEPAAVAEPAHSPALESEDSENAPEAADTETVAADLMTEEISEPADSASVSAPDTVPADIQASESTDTATPSEPADSTDGVQQPQQPSGQSALFDLDKIKRSRNNRRIIMTLYGESGTVIPSTTDRPTATTEPKDEQKSSTTVADDRHQDNRTAEPQDNGTVGPRMTDNTPQQEKPQQESCPPAPEPAATVHTHIPESTPVPNRTEPSSAFATEGKPRPVLGEVINAGSKTVGEAMAETPKHDITEKIVHSDHITDLNQAIGINDKFIMIRDLFNGDGARYDAAIAELNKFDNFDACLIHIASHYRWDPDSDGAKLLMEILSRKLL